MATIRRSLHQEILQPLDERLLAFVQVNKALKKKKPSYLCVSVTKDPPTVAYIHQVKKGDKNALKKKQSWPLNTLKIVDGKSTSVDNLDFDLHLDKVFKWSAENSQERQNFITTLWKESSHFPAKERPVFLNVPKEWVTTTEMYDLTVSNGGVPIEVSADAEDYQALSEKEETDLQQLMSQCGFAVSNAEQFIDTLAKHLSILDGENVQSVLASEQQVAQLMRQIDAALDQVSKVEAQLQAYDDVLCHIRTAMDKMEEKNSLIAVANKNNHKLLIALEKIVYELELPSKYQIALTDADLTSPQSLQDAIAAAKALQRVMNAEIHPGLLQLAAVQDQKKRFEKWRTKFSQILSHHLNNMFIYLGNDPGEFRAVIGPDLVLPKHTAMHRELSAYTELMHWCKAMDRKAFNSLTKVYTNSIGKLYERDVKQFLEDAKLRVAAGQTGKVSGSIENVNSKPWLSVSVSSRSPPSASLLGVDRELWAQEVSPAERLRFDQVFERVLSELEPVCLSEQNFCVHFFELGIQKLKNSQSNLEKGLQKNDAQNSNNPQKKTEKQMHEEVRKMMAEIFNCIEPEILSFINHHEKMDPVFRMYGLVRLSQHVMSAQDTGSFLSMTFGTMLVQVKRNYDRYMQTQLNSIQDCRPVRKGKCGILPFVYNFEDFARTADQIFKDTERRADLDKWYVRLVCTMFEAIPIIAADHPKTPPEVIKMENFHHLYDLLSRLKISVLDNQRKEAKLKYNEALKAYVTRYFGRPLEKLNLFFEGVQSKVAQGVKESEISYQLAFSKQELRKVVKEYPGKEVHRGLEQLYRKVEKHLCEEESLLQVVWRAMQEEFIVQYKYIDDMIQRCYPGSMVTLDFTIDNILQFFSEIARSH